MNEPKTSGRAEGAGGPSPLRSRAAAESGARDRAILTLTVLGFHSPYPGRGTACPGYLIEGFGTRLLLECGSGVLSRLEDYCSYTDLDAVVLSHLHFDHCSDALVLRYALDVAARSGLLTGPVPVWCPREPAALFDLMTYKEAMLARAIDPDTSVTVGGLTLTFVPVKHPVETYGVVLTPARAPAVGSMLFYTADTEWDDGLPQRVGICRVLLAEATLTDRQAALAPVTGHLTVGEAVRLGAATSAEKTVLTHYPPGRSPEDIQAEAGRVLPRPIAVAREGLQVTWP